MDDSDGQAISMAGFPLQMAENPSSLRLPPPRLGEHSAEILKDLLGYGDEDLSALSDDKVI
jgi:crotonobetainyl-CoA:carnitine CoA-transferase CaiB-like acyl-CoA transferase